MGGRMRVKEQEISVTEEKRIVAGMIISTDYMKRLKDVYRSYYFKNSYLEKIAGWSMSFFEEHKESPYKHIQDIFESQSHHLKETEVELIRRVLKNLSGQYDKDNINVDYLIDTTEEYFRTRELEIYRNNIEVHLENGDIEEAEAEMERFRVVSLALEENMYINPGDKKARARIYKKKEEQETNFFSLPGDLGKFIGNIKRGDVIGITAPQKKGKSFLLVDFFKQAVMCRKKVVHFSIEMTDTEMLSRIYKSFHPALDNKSEESFFPVFDCKKNQMGECKNRNSTVIVLDEDDKDSKKDFQYNPQHVPCDKCRRNGRRKLYQMATYVSKIHRDEDTFITMQKNIAKFDDRLSRYSRIVVRPKYSLTEELMMYDLSVLESRYNFIPDIILLDYIDIMQIKSTHDDYKLEDEKWKLLAKIAGQTKCAVVTVTQANKEGAKAEILHTTDQAGFYGKGRHVNLMLGINQMPDEKKKGIYRIGVLDSRSGRFNESETCTVLQDLKAGQMVLDSFWDNNYLF